MSLEKSTAGHQSLLSEPDLSKTYITCPRIYSGLSSINGTKLMRHDELKELKRQLTIQKLLFTDE